MEKVLIFIILIVLLIFFVYKKKNIESFSNTVSSCRGWSCSDENSYCPPGVPGSGSSGYCCLKDSNGSLRWKSGSCPGLFQDTWKNIATPWLRRIVAYGGNVYGIGGGKSIWKRPANDSYESWSGKNLSSSCCVTNIDVYENQIYGVGTSGTVWRRSINTNSGGWSHIITNGWVFFIKCYDGYVYGLGNATNNGFIYKHPISGGSWSIVNNSCRFKNIDISDGYIYGVGTNNAVYKLPLDGSSCTKIADCCVTQIQVYNGTIYGVGTNNWVYTHPTDNSQGWTQLPRSCCVQWITITDGQMFGLGMSYSLWFKKSLEKPYSNNVIKPIGGYNDKSSRALPYYLGNVGTDPRSAAQKCSKLSRNKGYKYFGLQCPGCGGQCFAGNDYNRAIQYGKTDCGSTGGVWKNYLYENLPSAEYINTDNNCTGDPNQKIYVSAQSNDYSNSNKDKEQCEKSCSLDKNCEMYLIDQQGGCHLYKDVSDVKMYCESGPGHAFYGKIKSRNMLDESKVTDLNNVSLPPDSDWYIKKDWDYKMPYTHHCNRKSCPQTEYWKTCKIDFNPYSKDHIQNWLKRNNVMIEDNPGNKNENGDAYISCKSMGYDATTPDMDKKYRKIGWNNIPFSCQGYPENINPEMGNNPNFESPGTPVNTY